MSNHIYTINHTASGSVLQARVIAKDILEAKEKFNNNQAFECEVRKASRDLTKDVFEIKKEQR